MEPYTDKITVVDSLMGTGKTTWAINYMKEHDHESFIFITPYISETERIKKQTYPECKFMSPQRTSATKGKLVNFNDLLEAEKDIVSTHELFKRFNETTKEILMFSNADYTLFIDETLDIITPVQIKPADIKLCIEKGLVSVNEQGICSWVYKNSEYDGRFEDIKQIAQTNSMICVNGSFFIWRLDPDIFKTGYFKKIIILTYMFDGSIMKPYFEYYNIPYEKTSISLGELVPYYEPDISYIAKLINLYDGPLNDVIELKKTVLSSSWYRSKGNENNIRKIKNSMYNYFRNILKAKAEDILWSTFLSEESTEDEIITKFGKTRFDKQFLSCNVRGTNDYREKSKLVYAINIYPNPGIQNFFKKKGLHINSNLYALQYMLQWIWRSCIRDNKPIDIYIPSGRMRKLFELWFTNKPIPDTYR